MTRRDRMEARLERRLDWAQSRDQKAEQSFNTANSIADGIPFGQPILVGHHSERHARADAERIGNNMDKGVESLNMADHHREKAAGIARALRNSIFSDDEDAPERLQEKIDALKAEQATLKAYNVDCRKAAKTGGNGDPALLSDTGRKDLLSLMRIGGWQMGAGRSMPGYHLSNLGANIKRLEARLQQITGTTPSKTWRNFANSLNCRVCGAECVKHSAFVYEGGDLYPCGAFVRRGNG